MTQEGEMVEAYRLNHNSAQATEIIAKRKQEPVS